MWKNCVFCGKPFIGVCRRQKYCCITCRLKAQKDPVKKINLKKGYKKDQLCWDCQKACGNCSWSKKLKPIKGWVVQPTIIKSNGEPTIHTYKIIKCPEFVRDEPR